MITATGLVKRYESKNADKLAVSGLDFSVPEGKLFTLLGPSGCGKTTTLRMIAGLERPSEGRLQIGDQVVFDSAAGVYVPPNKRPIGMVFQSYAIWPHMSVVENVAFPLTVGDNKPSREEARARALRMLEMVGLSEEADRSATAISGGQQQRVALARALVRNPKVLLLDEPLSNLDAQLRERMRSEIRSVQQQLGITAVYVTHDQGEALAISDLIMVMDKGKIVEMGMPQQIYRYPQAEFTANFIGVANAIDGTVLSSDASGVVVQAATGTLRANPIAELRAGEAVRAFIRPENIDLRIKRHADDDWEGAVRFSIYQGDCWDYTVDVNGHDVRVRVHKERTGLGHGDRVHLHPDSAEAVIMRMRDGVAYAFKPAAAQEAVAAPASAVGSPAFP
jgi:iron(III) transport system ATP-binding protein